MLSGHFYILFGFLNVHIFWELGDNEVVQNLQFSS